MSRFPAGSAVLLAALLLLPVPAASAASGITSPGDGEVVAGDAVVPLRAVVDGPTTSPSELSLLAPGAETAEVVAVSTSPEGGELSHDFDTACAPGVCTGRVPAANGTWTLRLSGAAQDERTFVLRIPPAAPDDVAAEPSEAGVLLRWDRGEEPDLRGYRVEDEDGDVVRDGIGLDACDAEGVCSAEVPETAGAWTVRAFRATCPDCAELLPSPSSRAVRADGTQVPLPGSVATPGASAQPSAGATPQQPQRSGSLPDQRSAFLGSFGQGRPSVSDPSVQARLTLPQLPQVDGSYEDDLGYGEREVVVREPRPALGRAQDAVTSALSTDNRWQLLVLSVLMVTMSLLMRRWVRRNVME